MMKRYFVFKDEKSDKFWSIDINNNTLIVNYGKSGSAGVTNLKVYPSNDELIKDFEKQINEKIKKGYTELTGKNIGQFSEVEFWSLIERSKRKSEDTEEQIEILRELLMERSESDIVEFANIFNRLYSHSYQSDLWAAAYIINGGCSDDGFDYFRGWLIAQGKDNFYRTLQNPEYLAKIIGEDIAGEVECEEMLSVAGDVYFEKTGVEYDDFVNLVDNTPYPEINLDWDDESIEKKFPKLWKKYS